MEIHDLRPLSNSTLRSKLASYEALRPAVDDDPESAVVTDLDSLVRELHRIFRDDVVNIEHVSEVLASYKSNPADWKKFAKFDRCKYTRNLVDEGNGKFNLMILCWGPDHGSAVHDHANAHCFMKGSLNEVRFSWPDNEPRDDRENEEGRPLDEISRTDLRLNDVCYINGLRERACLPFEPKLLTAMFHATYADTMGLHRVENPSHSNPAVSLHLYSPPFNSCSVFNQRTGKRSSCNVTFWSKSGKKIKEGKSACFQPENNS